MDYIKPVEIDLNEMDDEPFRLPRHQTHPEDYKTEDGVRVRMY